MDKAEKKVRIMTYLRFHSGYMGSARINQALGIDDNISNSATHAILKELEDEGKLEQSHNSKGFRISAKHYVESDY